MSQGAYGFADVTNPPRLGVAYADAIITQTELALWGLRRGYLSDIRMRSTAIRRNRRWVTELAAEQASRVPA